MAATPSLTSARLTALLARLKRLEEVAQSLPAVDVAAKLAKVRDAKSPWARLLDRTESLACRVAKLEAASSDHSGITSALGGPAGAEQLDQVVSRIELLERGVIRAEVFSSSPAASRVHTALKAKAIAHDFVRVDDANVYYSLPVANRASLVGAPGPHNMLKTLLVSAVGGSDNEGDLAEAEDDASRDGDLVLVVLQYTASLDTAALKRTLKKIPVFGALLSTTNNAGGIKPSLASAKCALRVLGFESNGVAPVGGLQADKIPVVVAEAIMKLPSTKIVCGGGEPDVKLRMDMAEFVSKHPLCFVGDFTKPRPAAEAVMGAVPPPGAPAAPRPSPASLPLLAAQPSANPKASAPSPSAPAKTTSSPDASSGGVKRAFEGDEVDFNELDVRVGLVTKAWKHPESEKLLCEEIDVGEGKPRPIASGLQQFYSPEAFQGKRVVVVCNLKPAKLGGYSSEGMVLCASWDNKSVVRLLEPPSDAAVGDRVIVAPRGGAAPALVVAEPLSANQVKKKKTFELVAEHLKLGAHGVCQWQGRDVIVQNTGSACTCATGPEGAHVA